MITNMYQRYGSRFPYMFMALAAAKRPQHDIGNYLGPCILQQGLCDAPMFRSYRILDSDRLLRRSWESPTTSKGWQLVQEAGF